MGIYLTTSSEIYLNTRDLIVLEIQNEIVKFIKRNRVSTTEVADALGKDGLLPALKPMTQDQHKVGKIRCIFAAHESNYAVHEQIREIEEGEVIIVFVHECKERAILGDLVTRYVMMYQGAEALVVDGAIRDVARLRREKYPVWASGITPIGCFNTPSAPFPADKVKMIKDKYEGGVAVCDDGGVVVIPSFLINANMLEKLHQIELQEDVWSYCLNTLKWDTKRIVCDKEYLTNVDTLPDVYKESLNQL